MKLLAVLTTGLWLLMLLPARAQQSADDQYVIIYSIIQQADSFQSGGQPSQALRDFIEAQAELQRFQKIYPDWNPKIVNYRLNYLADKIADLTPQVPVTNAPPVLSAPAHATASSATNAALQAEVKALQAQMQSLQANNTALAAKLKEALAVQPAAIDVRELTRAQEQIRSLMKENDLLRVSLAQGRAAPPPAGAQGRSESKALAQMQKELDAANKKLAAEMTRADKLARENETLRARREAELVSPEAMEALRQENALLKKQIAALQSGETNSLVASLTAELAEAHRQISILQSNAQMNALEKLALQNRVQQLQAGARPAPPPSQAENEARIRELTQERDDLLAKLAKTNQALYGPKKQDLAAQVDALTGEVNRLRARVEVDEAQAVPYTREELALFRQPATLAANPNAQKKSVKELPEGSASLVAEARKYFAAGEYDKAEADYQQILQRDQNNGLVLANLATIELQQNKLADAERHITNALAQSPNDAYNLATLGKIKFAEGKYDDALNALSQAAKLDPQNPEIQNYLGVTLSHKGLRQQAETALRKAVQLDPNYGPAHNNLAVIYLTQQPSMPALARWHYQKALDAGQPRNPDLEKLLAEKGVPVSP